MDQACHQRVSVIAGVSQLRTARSAWGQLGAGGVAGHARGCWDWAAVPPLLRACRRGPGWRRTGGPAVPAEGERAVDQHLVTANGDIGANLEVGPPELVLDLLVRLLYPMAQPVDPHDLS